MELAAFDAVMNRLIGDNWQDKRGYLESKASNLRNKLAQVIKAQHFVHQYEDDAQHIQDVAKKATDYSNSWGIFIVDFTHFLMHIDI